MAEEDVVALVVMPSLLRFLRPLCRGDQELGSEGLEDSSREY